MVERNTNPEASERTVPLEVANAYKGYVEVLPREEQDIRVESGYISFTRKELVGHLLEDDEIGALVTDAFYDLSRKQLSRRGIDTPSKEEIITRTIDNFNNARERQLERKNG